MKLVELLAKELSEWPSKAGFATQDKDGEVRFMGGCGTGYDFYLGIIADYDDSTVQYGGMRYAGEVTESQWQAERDRLKGGEWKRARGRKPKYETETPQRMEVRHRDGDITKGWTSQSWNWSHNDGCPSADIMAWRIISQPQAEEVEYRGPFPCAPIGETVNAMEFDIDFPSGSCSVESKTDQMETPLKWRDEVTELNAYIEKYTRERDALIERLASEGFALIAPVVSVISEFSGVDMSDWRNWKRGDIVKVIQEFDRYNIGDELYFDKHDFNDSDQPINLKGHNGSSWPEIHQVEFVSRP